MSNTPPARMLGLDPTQIAQSAGDSLGSFWTPTQDALAAIQASPATEEGSNYKLPPHGVRREAYSWGALARISNAPGVLSLLPRVIYAALRSLWVLIIPFGLTNVAYWSRLLRPAGAPGGGGDPRERRNGSAAVVQLFGLALTLLVTASSLTLAVGVIGMQCYKPETSLTGVVTPEAGATGAAAQQKAPPDYVPTCEALPGQLDFLARWTPGQRVTLTSGAAVAVLLGISLVGAAAVVRFDRRTSTNGAKLEGAPTIPDSWPWLARPDLWGHGQDSWASWMPHVAAAFALVELTLATQFVVVVHSTAPAWPVLTVVASVVLFAAAVVIALRPALPPAGGTSASVWWFRSGAVILALSIVGLVVALYRTWKSGDDLGWTGDAASLVAPPLVVPGYALPFLVATFAVLVVAALAARTTMRWWVLLVLSLAVLALLGLSARNGSHPRNIWMIAAGCAAVVLALFCWFWPHWKPAMRPYEGWRGRGTAVFLALSGGFALLISSAVTAVVISLLQAPAAAENAKNPKVVVDALAEISAQDPVRDAVVTGGTANLSSPLSIPAGLDGFSVTGAVAVGVFLLIVGLLAVRDLWARHKVIIPVAGWEPGSPPAPASPSVFDRSITGTRRMAGLAHRAEPVVGILAVLMWLAIVGALFVRPFAPSAGDFQGWASWDPGALAHSWAPKLAALAGGFLVVSVGAGGAAAGAAGRPWGLLWDLTCFLPRVAHPFAAPCYAERAVPELRGRIDEWLGTDTGADERRDRSVEAIFALEQAAGVVTTKSKVAKEYATRMARRRVIVSAHSLGALVSVAAIMARWEPGDDPLGRVPRGNHISLLTYGTQLRSYFGRFLPELFGPQVLGTEPHRGASITSTDPFAASFCTDTAWPGPQMGSLVWFLSGCSSDPGIVATASPRWRSLWRRTDYLGFPVDSYRATRRNIDHADSEEDASSYLFKVATHGGDFTTPEYARELAAMVEAAARDANDEQDGADDAGGLTGALVAVWAAFTGGLTGTLVAVWAAFTGGPFPDSAPRKNRP